MKIENFLQKKHILFTKEKEKHLVIKEMVERLEKLGEINNAGRYYAQIMHRESIENTGVGRALAIPHVRTESIGASKNIFAVSQHDIDYHSYDNVPVRYLLLSIVPTEESTKYVYLIGMMSWIFMDNARRNLLAGATTAAQVYSALGKNIKSYFENIDKKKISGIDYIENLSGVPSYNLDILIRLDRLYKLVEKGEMSQKIKSKIIELRKIVDQKSLVYYDKMKKKSLNPFAILNKNACTECHMEIAPVYLAQISESKHIAVCNHCGRFLIVL
ncbi:MAG: PTS sugar transporter subunit IIA [Spirochaetes bacterium]|nr:PTS sugar transporter subunit IIA [Spirochaetota bacterium]